MDARLDPLFEIVYLVAPLIARQAEPMWIRLVDPGRGVMEDSYPKLRLWAGATAVRENPWLTEAPPPLLIPGMPTSSEAAERLYNTETFAPAPSAPSDRPEPYTLQWYLDIESRRHGRRGRWLPRLLEFAKHAGETVLGLGHSLGTDWLQYARHGAGVVVCSPSSTQLELIQRNFELRGLGGRFIHAAPAALPLESASVDVACMSGPLETAEQSSEILDEVYRVLKPGGKVLAVVPARYDVYFWYRICFFLQAWMGGRHRADEGVARFSGRRLRRWFGRFVEHRIYKRQLRRAELPHLWRWIPLPMLERLMGRVLVVKAFKPLSAAIPSTVQAAA